jgi:non-specific serine/threonine protein kinase
LKDCVGLHDLSQLIRNPNQKYAAIELAASRGRGQVIEHDGGDVLDRRAKRECLRRVDELREEISDAERLGETPRAACARAEMERILDEVKGALGLGARSRRMSATAERARLNVTRTIRTSIDRIAERDGWLGRYLRRTIRTGGYCSYMPDVDVALRWTSE